MYEGQRSHPLLAQIPLTVSPFISIPSAITLPYTFRTVPSSLPPSIVAEVEGGGKQKYISSSSGHTAHPDDIIVSCTALQDHIKNSKDEAQRLIREWERQIKENDLAEKRRVAPGWLDRDEKILEPMKVESKADTTNLMDIQDLSEQRSSTNITMPISREAEEIDRAFGNLAVK